ncbi:uncharacterized protein LOC123877510 [Maniola jurtina]|uniref:uncharacterized protein LOC123877510 n=1 Tax=Maniola jurtina TaxID=191418 RepID=UPI001E68D229|nr:uncharacterized protein LOC123877510 [Maniola jurtina]
MRFGYVFILNFLHCTYGERRLIGGEDVKTEKRYMAYLLKAKSSIRNYDAWICGGAIVSRWLMLTSAACVEDVQNMYAIAGTEMYVKEGELDDNVCTRHMKRKVIYTWVPIAYDLQYDQVSKWSHNDVAIVTVERPFVSSAKSWRDCSYRPDIIPVNFDPKYEEPGTGAIVLGWGHTSKWRFVNPFVSSSRSWRDCSYRPDVIPVNFDPKYEEPGTDAIVLGWGHTSKWRFVTVVKVEKPFVSSSRSWRDCSYRPDVIPVNFDPKYEEPGTDAIVLGWGHTSKWRFSYVAVVKVERPFVSSSRSWRDCSYRPDVIPVNFDPKYEEPGTDAIVLGWGHTSKWRFTNSTDDLNQRQLQYASVSVLDNEECKKSFTTPEMEKQIDDYMICTFHDGNLDETGKMIGSRKNANVAITVDGEEITDMKKVEKYLNSTQKRFNLRDGNMENPRRRKGFCQNDHGGPLVTWINDKEHVIGIASVFRVDNQSNCMGPFLYTSTTKNREFIECILSQTDGKVRRRLVCDTPKNGKEFVIIRRCIKWTDTNTNR